MVLLFATIIAILVFAYQLKASRKQAEKLSFSELVEMLKEPEVSLTGNANFGPTDNWELRLYLEDKITRSISAVTFKIPSFQACNVIRQLLEIGPIEVVWTPETGYEEEFLLKLSRMKRAKE